METTENPNHKSNRTSNRTPDTASSTIDHRAVAAERVAQLRLIAKACNAAAQESNPSQPDAELPIFAGWTIFVAGKERLLNSILDLAPFLEAVHGQIALERTEPRFLPTELPRQETVGEFLARLDETKAPEQLAPLPLMSEGASPGAAHALHASPTRDTGLDGIENFIKEIQARSAEEIRKTNDQDMRAFARAVGDAAARGLIQKIWESLAQQHQGQLPAAAIRLFVKQARGDGQFSSRNAPRPIQDQLIECAWVTSFLSDQIAIRWSLDTVTPPPADTATGQKTGFMRLEDIRLANPNFTDEEIDRVRKNLENWRNKHEDACIQVDEDHDTGRRRWLYPAAQVQIFAQRVISKQQSAPRL